VSATPGPGGARSPLRVAYITNAHGVGGAERMLLALVADGRERGFEQVVLNPFATEASHALAEACSPTEYRAKACAHVFQLPRLRRWLRRELDAFAPDIVHVMLLQATVTAASLRRAPSTRWMITHAYGEGVHARHRPRLSTWLDAWACRRYDVVVGMSEAVKRFIVGEYQLERARVEVIMPGWEGHPREPLRNGRPPTVICIARFRPEKGHALLLEAFARVAREIPDARLVLVGDGELLDATKNRARELGLTDRVSFPGATSDIWTPLSDADVFALASVSEAAGIAIMEAMAAGLPVVAPAVGGIPEIVSPGQTGELAQPGDPQDLARGLVALLGDAERRAEMAERARHAAERHRMTASVERYLDLYERIRPD
jgi:glycosyltransferase involved in cell wall biosynthesis